MSLFVACIAACGGGGGGGDDTGFYGGTWNFRGALLINECGGDVSNPFVVDLLVNQDGDGVVVNSGSATLTGSVTENDGFLVTDERVINGCNSVAGYEFRNASDGEADVAFAIILNCGGVSCSVGWGGTARLLSARDALEGDGDIDLSLDKLTRGSAKSAGTPSAYRDVHEVLNEVMGR